IFFFSSRRRHTRSKRDWSSDVCSSDLCQRLIEDISEINLGSHNQIDHRDVDRGFLELETTEILRVLFGRHKRVHTSLFSCLLDLQDVPLRIAMVIWKDCLATNSEPPISQIAEERVWIAETAKCKKRAGADFIGGERSDLSAETAESKQSSGGSENRILIELSDSLERSRRRFGTGKNNQICATHGCNGLPKPAGRQ